MPIKEIARRLGDRPIVVADRRTCQLAERRINAAIDEHDLACARAGIEALRIWRRRQLRNRAAQHVQYAHALEGWELRAEKEGLSLSG